MDKERIPEEQTFLIASQEAYPLAGETFVADGKRYLIVRVLSRNTVLARLAPEPDEPV